MKYRFYYYIEKKGTGTVEADSIEEAEEMAEQGIDVKLNDDEKTIGYQICSIGEGGE